ncbi:Flagellar hook protein FlgE [Candidatus Rhodobacter oscarellae]|uniref:Flagellar hook protein FlgE n=1 Tax=Candidatus Rhodobacter oscarellae TaxID=1675527 RepID=A0A0J9EB76_9RHOB|nr:flagellar hook-basal body complex protein [Candidatus Rhodobacter lobularis]KMW60035.1 Flagellar hook protein FlgE [Candidatus Rhodobacter lobularis]
MTISSSLAAGVAGLNANAARLATISDNIANSSTYGYKKAVMDFSSLVGPDSGSSYTAGGVRTSTMRLIDQRGSLINTNNPTDLAVSGRGLLPVTQASSITPGQTNFPLQLVTTGSFRPDSDGILTSETGLVLMGWPANIDGTVPPYPRDTTNGLEPVRVTVNQFAGDPTTEINVSVNLPATGTEAGAPGDLEEMSLEYYGNMGTSELLDVTFTPNVPATGSSNEWTMEIVDSSTGTPTVIAEYVLTFSDSRVSGGTLAAVVPGASNPATSSYDATTGSINLDTIHGNIDLVIGVLNDPGGMTQLSDSFAPVSISKDGSPVGNLTSVEVDSKGFVSAIYDIGFTRTIYQIPLVDVPNPNGLEPLANQAYQTTPDSGPFFLWDAGDGPWGEVVGFAREESTTDVAAELTQLIQTQRAYSSNAKVIQTVDEMLQETTNIKR